MSNFSVKFCAPMIISFITSLQHAVEDHMQTQRLQIELLWGRMMKDCCSGSYHMTCEGINSTCIMYAYLLQNLDLLLHMANSFVICWTSSFLKPLVIKSLRIYMQQLIFKLLEWSNTKFFNKFLGKCVAARGDNKWSDLES